MVIQHNMHAMFSQRQLGITTKDKAKSQEKLSSGYKINRAADNAAGLAISEKMRKQIRGLTRGMQNTTEGISFVQIADGAMAEVHDMIHRMSELAIQAANGTNSESDRKAIDAEVQQLKTEINRIGETTKYNEIRIFDQEIAAPSFTMHGRYYALEDINMYNATYDAETGKVTYGGMILNGERVSWDSVNPNMVTTDANGRQIFVGGDYSFSFQGFNYKIHCDDGAAVPQIKREFDFTGTPEFLYLGKNRYNWSDFVDGNGYALSMYTLHEGTWTRKGSTDTIEIDFVQRQDNLADLADIKAAADDGLIQQPDVVVEERWSHAVQTQAMEMVTEDADGKLTKHSSVTSENVTTEEQMRNILFGSGGGRKAGTVSYRLRADKEDDGKDPVKTGDYKKNGVWLEEWKTVDKYDEDGNKIPVIAGYDGDGNPIQAKDGSGNLLWKKEERWVMVADSLKTWEELGLQDENGDIWKSGTDIRKYQEKPEIFHYSDVRSDGTTIGFTFTIDAEVTSLDSLIDGINEAAVYNKRVSTSYMGTGEVTNLDSVLDFAISMTAENGELLNAEEEYAWGRDYTQRTVDGVASGTVELSGRTPVVKLKNAAGTQSIDLMGNSGDVNKQIEDLAGDTDDLVKYVEKKKTAAVLKGEINPDVEIKAVSRTLADVVGKDSSGKYNYTTMDWPVGADPKWATNLIEEVTIDPSFDSDHRSNGGGDYISSYRLDDGTFGGAHIDFQNINSGNLMDLVGTGFDSTCMGCSNHFSVIFTSGEGSQYSYSVQSTSGSQLKYNVSKLVDGELVSPTVRGGSGSGHYLLSVDLDSFQTAGVGDGVSFAENLLKIVQGNYDVNGLDQSGVSRGNNNDADEIDFHYQQYAVKGSTFYIVDNRSYCRTSLGNSYGIFAMQPYEEFIPKTQGDYSYSLKSGDGKRTANLGYTYDFTDIKDDINVEMVQLSGAAANEAALKDLKEGGTVDLYEKNGSNYVKYTMSYDDYKKEKARASLDPSDPNYKAWTEPTLYKVKVTYKQADGSFKSEDEVTDAKKKMQDAYAENAVKEMLENTKIKLNATDYTKVTWGVDEQPNVAMDSRFETTVNVSGYGKSKGIKIQHSGHTRDWTYIPQFTLNTFALGIYRADCSDETKATLTIDLANRALKAVSYRRSVYGAIQNRLEHTYNNRYNTMENTTAAESRLRDTDMAKEISRYSKHNILEQAGQSMLAQANQSTNGIMSLLQ